MAYQHLCILHLAYKHLRDNRSHQRTILTMTYQHLCTSTMNGNI